MKKVPFLLYQTPSVKVRVLELRRHVCAESDTGLQNYEDDEEEEEI